jgi:hypothetical protein
VVSDYAAKELFNEVQMPDREVEPEKELPPVPPP